MDLSFTPDEIAFRARGMRDFFARPRSRPTSATMVKKRRACGSATSQVATQRRILNAHGLAVPHWPEAWGGQGWTPVQMYIYQDEMQQAAGPAAARLQREHGGAGDRPVRQ